jgi:hypothetical protein
MQQIGQEIEQLLISYAERTGFPVDELNRLRAERQAERRRLLAIQTTTGAQVTDEEEAAFVHGVRSRHAASGAPPTPSAVVTLNQPDGISAQHTNPVQPIDVERNIEPFNSSARVLIQDVHSGGDTAVVAFQFTWANASTFLAFISISTLLRFTGFVQAQSDTGFFGVDPVSTNLVAALDVTGSDGTSVNVTGNIRQQVGGFRVRGGDWPFGDADSQLQSFTAAAFGLGTNFFAVQAGDAVMISVQLSLGYDIEDTVFFDSGNFVVFDFWSTQFNRRVSCPFLHVEVFHVVDAGAGPRLGQDGGPGA